MSRTLYIATATLLAACASTNSSTEAEDPRSEQQSSSEPEAPLWEDYPWTQCKATVDRETHMLECDDLVISRTVVEWPSDWAQDTIVNATLATLREGAETVGLTRDRQPARELYVEGGHGYKMQLVAREEPELLMPMTTYARLIEGQTVVGVACIDTAQKTHDRCLELSPWMAGTLPEVRWVDVSTPSTFAGRTLQAPEGCDDSGDETIVCGSTELVWFHADDPASDSHRAEMAVVERAIRRMNRERTGMSPEPVVREFDCHLDGELARCRLEQLNYAENSLYILTAHGNVRGQKMAALCDWTSDQNPGDAIPRPCNLVIDGQMPSVEPRP